MYCVNNTHINQCIILHGIYAKIITHDFNCRTWYIDDIGNYNIRYISPDKWDSENRFLILPKQYWCKGCYSQNRTTTVLINKDKNYHLKIWRTLPWYEYKDLLIHSSTSYSQSIYEELIYHLPHSIYTLQNRNDYLCNEIF